MWEIYDTLIEGIDPSVKTLRAFHGSLRAVVESDVGCGMSSLLLNEPQPEKLWGFRENFVGKLLRDVAALVKSWDNEDAALGMAAINSYYNSPDFICTAEKENKITISDGDVFRRMLHEAKGKKAAMIGHFRGISELYSPVCDFTIFERDPRSGDLPDTAAEYLLPEMDIVFITGMTFTNKTLPRLLTLAKNARVIITGPSAPLSHTLFDFGIDTLSGVMIKDASGCFDAAASHEWNRIYSCADKISITGFTQNN